MKLKIDNFVISIIAVIALAYVFSETGISISKIPIDTIGSIGVSLIFFFYGLKLSAEKIRAGLRNWKLHVLVQTTTFVVFPLLVLMFYPFVTTESSRLIWISFLFLAALPSTVSSSVVMVSIAKGNLPAAIFNASISGLIGILVTPLWIGIFMKQRSVDYQLGDVYTKLVLEILLPVVVGVFLQPYLGRIARKFSRELNFFDKTIILLIIYKNFAESFEAKVFRSVLLSDLVLISVITILLFYSVFFISGYISRRLNFVLEDQITAQFCATKKSLVHGTVFSKILFPATMPLGVLLMPLMLFHAFQIFIISIRATKLGNRFKVKFEETVEMI